MPKLQDYFALRDIEFRLQRCWLKDGKMGGMALAYLTSRSVMQRFDDACTPFGWQVEIKPVVMGSVQGFLCGISVKSGDEWVTKWDGADLTDIESFKGGISSSIKRAAVLWGVGRYLYELESGYVEIHANKPAGVLRSEVHYVNDAKKNVKGYWASPAIPDRFLPKGA